VDQRHERKQRYNKSQGRKLSRSGQDSSLVAHPTCDAKRGVYFQELFVTQGRALVGIRMAEQVSLDAGRRGLQRDLADNAAKSLVLTSYSGMSEKGSELVA
jgi:hypothetical protein